MKRSPAVASMLAAALLLSGCAANEKSAPSDQTSQAGLSGELSGGGASSQGSAQQAWIAGFQTANPNVTVNYDPTGSGTGRESFQSGAFLFAGSDRAFKTKEIKEGRFGACAQGSGIVEFPAYISPIAVVFNLEGVKSLKLDAPTIAGIFAGKITKWDDPAIASQNPDVKLPAAQIKPVHRSDKSGTTQNFTDYLSAAAADAWSVGAVEEWPSEFGGEGAAQTSGMVSAVKNGVNTIGYVDASRAEGLGTVEVKVGDKYVPYSPEAAAKIVDASPIEEGRGEHDLAFHLDRNSSAAGVYPIVLVSYLIGCQKYQDSEKAKLVKGYFASIVSSEGQQEAAKSAGSAPLSDDLRGRISAIIDAIE